MDLGVDIIYVINLPTYPERKETILKLFNDFNITNFEIIEAIAGEDLPDQNELINNGTLNPIFIDSNGLLTKNIIACALSHRLAYQAFIDSKHQTCLILEDDASFSKEMYSYIGSGKFEVLKEQIKEVDYDLFLWGRMYDPMIGKNKTNLSEIYTPDLLSDKYSAHAYQLNRNSAEKLLNKVLPIRYAADVFLETLDFKVYCPKHTLFIQKRGYIDEHEMERLHLAIWQANAPQQWQGATAVEVRKTDDEPYMVQNCNIAPSFNVDKVVFKQFKSYLSKKPQKWAHIHLKR